MTLGFPVAARIRVGVIALLAVHAVIALWSAAGRSVAVDEIFHVTGGYVFDRFGDFRIQPENGVLPQRCHGLPAVLLGAKPPPMAGNEYWRTSDLYVISYQFFYESGNDHWPLLMGARAMNLLFSLGLGVLVFAWARRLAGTAAGFVALGLVAFSPTFLAHGPMATTDMAAAFFLTASAGAFWRQLSAPAHRATLLSAATFGLTCVAKFSAVLLLPVFALMIAAHLATTPRAGWKPGRIIAQLAVHAALAWLVIWTCYEFRYSAFAPGVPAADHFITQWNHLMQQAGWQGRVLNAIAAARLFPEAFIYGYAHTYVASLSRSAFLAGEHGTTGWVTFFPLAFAWKSTPVELLGVVASAVAAALHWRKLRPWLARLAPLLALAAVYGAAAITSHLNIGHRHLLPLYPALFIVSGVALAKLARRWRGLGAGAVVAAQAASVAPVFPHALAYFNPIAGGPANGWRLLVDSSLDWGQDLPALKRWLDENNRGPGASRVFLSYFGSAEPNYHGIRATRMLFVDGFKFPLGWYEPAAGIYCISATMLQQVYSPGQGEWTAAREKEFQDLRRLEPEFRRYFTEAGAREKMSAAVGTERWQRGWQRYEILRQARLCAYLRARGPDAMAGYSILIFRVSEDELRRVLNSPYSVWQEAIAAAKK